jgi:hypothetical protein
VLQNDPGVRVARGFGNFQESYFIRGFILNSDDVAYNGLYSLLPRQYIATELFERVEVLRGASAFLTGANPGGGGIGGAINLLPKRAPNEPLTRVSVGLAATRRSRCPPTSRAVSAPTTPPASASTPRSETAAPRSTTKPLASACCPSVSTGTAATCACPATSVSRTTASSARAHQRHPHGDRDGRAHRPRRLVQLRPSPGRTRTSATCSARCAVKPTWPRT